jgi:error-prone DNA polymerase
MGFYQPAQLVIDARQHGVEVRPVDVNLSQWDNLLEEKAGQYYAVRLGFRQVSGLREDDMQVLMAGRSAGYPTITALRDAGVPQTALEKLADADAFRSIGLDRRQALWEVSALADTPVALFEGQPSESVTEAQVSLPFMSAGEHVLQDYAATALSLKAHPVSFVREKLKLLHVLAAHELKEKKDGDLVKVAGLVLVRQRPGTASGICFMTIEDETGNANLVVFQKLFDQFRKTILQSKLIMVEGRLQKEGEVIHVVLMRCHNYNKLLGSLSTVKDEEQDDVFHKGRNFK